MTTVRIIATCPECDRRFNLLVPEQADEWYGGHDCEEAA